MAHSETLPAPTKPRVGRVADPCIMVIFGFSGDLTRRKLIPALYNLASQQLLSREFAIVGVARNPMSDDERAKKLTEDFKQFASGSIDADLWDWFARRMHYVSGDFDDPNTYKKLQDPLPRLITTMAITAISSFTWRLRQTFLETLSSGSPTSA